MVATSDLSSGDQEARQLLRRRLALVCLVLTGIFTFATAGNVLALVLRPELRTTGGTFASWSGSWGPLVLAGALAVLAWRLRRRDASLGALRALDAGVTVLVCWTMGGLFLRVPPSNESAVAIMLAGTYVLMARSVFLPSSGRRTLIICLVALLPIGAAAAALRSAAAGRTLVHANGYEILSALRPVAVTTFLATIASRTIYGLRRQIRRSARIGQYVLREKIGAGGMGVVYRATHALLRRDTAIKLLNPSRVGADNLARFEREVKLTARLTHPNTVAVFDYGHTPDNLFYYAMEYLAGGDLDELVDYAGPLPPARVIWILDQVCRALREAHNLGLVHRDIKPNNILVCERGLESDVAKVVDFGLVKDLNSEQDQTLTMAGGIAGTPLYMSPEAATARQQIDGRSDLYSLGAVAYTLLVGEPVFAGRTMVEICAHHLHTEPVPPSRRAPRVPADLEAVVLRCLSKRPEDRFASAGEMRDALLACHDAGCWGTAEAAAWWDDHRAAFGARTQARRRTRFPNLADAVVSSTQAVAVDLDRLSP
jgi:serine/threonine-protein kinase